MIEAQAMYHYFIYPVTLTPDEIDGGFVATFADLPEAITQGENLADALAQAADALEEAVAGRIRRGEDIPQPSRPATGQPVIRPSTDFFTGGRIPKGAGWASVARVALRKLDMLDYARQLDDLRSPPGNRLEALRGDLAGLHSIRMNDRWRIVFRWTADGPALVKIVDYH